MRPVHGLAVDFVQEAMVDDHPDERSRGQQGIDRAKGSFLNPGFDIAGQIIVDDPMLLAEEHVGQFVALQAAEQEEPQHGGVGAGADAVTGDQRKEPLVIPLARDVVDGFHQGTQVRLFRKNGGIERALSGKVFEEQRFADSGGFGDFLGPGPAKTPRGEERRGGGDETGLAISTGGSDVLRATSASVIGSE